MLILSIFLTTSIIESKQILCKKVVKFTGFIIWGLGVGYVAKNIVELYKEIERFLEKYSAKEDAQINIRSIPLVLFKLIAPFVLMYLGNELSHCKSICSKN